MTWVPPGAADLSWNAVCTTRFNALPAGLRVRTRRGNLCAPVAGRDGRLVLDRICGEAPELLRPGGVLLLVQSALSGTEETLRWCPPGRAGCGTCVR